MSTAWKGCVNILRTAFQTICNHGKSFSLMDEFLFKLYKDEPIYDMEIDLQALEPVLYEAHGDVVAQFDKLFVAMKTKDRVGIKAELLKLIKEIRCFEAESNAMKIKDNNYLYFMRSTSHFV